MKKNEELKKEQKMTDEELMNVTGGFNNYAFGGVGYGQLRGGLIHPVRW